MQHTILTRLRSLDLLGPAGGVLGCSLLAFACALLACIFHAPGRLHDFFVFGAMGQSALAFISTLQLLGLMLTRPESDVQDLHIAP